MPRSRTQKLGQHFLVDQSVLEKIVQACVLGKTETVCEAGTGTGVLTKEMCSRAGRVVSYEVDGQLFRQAKLMQIANLELVNRDLFREHDIEFDVFVSNLPYSKSRDAFEWLAARKFDRAIVMVQKEFAEKLCSRPGDKYYRAITTIASYCFAIEPLFDVGRDAFEPRPNVESTVLKITPIRRVTEQHIKNANLLFSKRNKKASTVAAKMGIDADFGQRRVFQLEPAEIMGLAG
ncbi:rRNA adenine dimethyltransferase family protein [Nitrososphaera sp.]|uniref:ribosomal RNA small subunit methyltransferase A n=1 Tax=Nitrososphaera sp. TaxID=1971748 RepID=UPI002EDB7945